MKPSKPFLVLLMVAAVAGASAAVAAPHAQAATPRDSMPLSTKLTPAIIDYFGLQPAFEPPNMPALVACAAASACGASDSVRVRFVDASGQVLTAYDGAPTTAIERVTTGTATPTDGVTVYRHTVRRFVQEDGAKVLMTGTDSIVTSDTGAPGRAPSTVVRMHRYAAMRYLVNDPRFPWPLTGLVTLELSETPGASPRRLRPPSAHAAVSFDGTPTASIVTSGALTHRVHLRARVLETTLPDR